MLKRFLSTSLIFLIIACNPGDKTHNDEFNAPPLPAPQPITFSIDGVYPHDTSAFTQGLHFYDGKLYEGTGQFRESTLRIVDPKTGEVQKKYVIPDATIFGEGVTIFNNKIYQLTWESHKIFVYNVNDITRPVKTLNWPYDGWGITHDGNRLIISDGSDKIYYALPDEATNTMNPLKVISVKDNTGALDAINELEFIDGYIYANRWQTDDILKIDTATGNVVGKMDLKGLLFQYAPNVNLREGAVLNGIAYDSSTKKLFITGKYWPKMFEVRLNN